MVQSIVLLSMVVASLSARVHRFDRDQDEAQPLSGEECSGATSSKLPRLPSKFMGLDLFDVPLKDVSLMGGQICEVSAGAPVSENLQSLGVTPEEAATYKFAYPCPGSKGLIDHGAFLYEDHLGHLMAVRGVVRGYTLSYEKQWEGQLKNDPCVFFPDTFYSDAQEFCWDPKCDIEGHEDQGNGCFIYKMASGSARAYVRVKKPLLPKPFIGFDLLDADPSALLTFNAKDLSVKSKVEPGSPWHGFVSDELKVSNWGQDCWDACGHVDGFCMYCGLGACCRQDGYKSKRNECQNAEGYTRPNQHQCVKPAGSTKMTEFAFAYPAEAGDAGAFVFFNQYHKVFAVTKLIPGSAHGFENVWEGRPDKPMGLDELEGFIGCRLESRSLYKDVAGYCWAPKCSVAGEKYSMIGCFVYRMDTGPYTYRAYVETDRRVLPKSFLGVGLVEVSPNTDIGEVSESGMLIDGRNFSYAYPFFETPKGAFIHWNRENPQKIDSIRKLVPGSDFVYEKEFEVQEPPPCQLRSFSLYADVEAFCYLPQCYGGRFLTTEQLTKEQIPQCCRSCFVYQMKNSTALTGYYRGYIRRAEMTLLPLTTMGFELVDVGHPGDVEVGDTSVTHPLSPAVRIALGLPEAFKAYSFAYPFGDGDLKHGGFVYYDGKGQVLDVMARQLCSKTNTAKRCQMTFENKWQGVPLTGEPNDVVNLATPKSCSFHPVTLFADAVAFCWIPECSMVKDTTNGCFVYKLKDRAGLRAYVLQV